MLEIKIIEVLMSIIAGGAVGLLFFGGLWFTVRVIYRVKHPGWLMLFSFIVRIIAFLTAFYLIARYGNWLYLVFALAAALIVRTVLMRTIGPSSIERNKLKNDSIESEKN